MDKLASRTTNRVFAVLMIAFLLGLLFFPQMVATQNGVQSAPNEMVAVNFYLPFGADARSTGKTGVLVGRTGIAYRSFYTNGGLETVEQADCAGVQDKLCYGAGGDYHDYGDKLTTQRAAIDFILPYGAPVLAAADGTVTQIGKDSKGNACSVSIRHSDNTTSLYLHLSRVTVKKDNPVKRGDAIGEVGNNPCGGSSVGAHLHFALWQGNNEIPIRFSDRSVQNHGGYVRPSKLRSGLQFPYLADGPQPVPADDALLTPGASPFTDVTTDNLFYREIVLLHYLGVFKGYADGKFQPDTYLTRGQMAKIIVLAIGEDTIYSNTSCIFDDVCGNNAFYHYIRKLVDLGVVSPRSNTNPKFNVDKPIERGQFAKMAIRARVAAGYDANYPSYSNCSPPFVDVPCTDTFYNEIRRLKEIFTAKGISLGYSTNRYQTGPNGELDDGNPDESRRVYYNQIKRDQVAKLIVYSLNLEGQLPSFWDVPNENKFFRYVEGMVKEQLTTGCTTQHPPHPQFCVNQNLTRAETAKFIVRGMGANPTYSDCAKPFPDVDCNLAGDLYKYIRYLKERNIAQGNSNGLYDPGGSITRGELASLSIRTLTQLGIRCPDAQAAPFPDVPLSNTHGQAINCLKELGVVSGYSDGNFKPDKYITRGESAKIIYLGFVDILPNVPQEADDQTNDTPQGATKLEVVDTTDDVEDTEVDQIFVTEGADTDYSTVPVETGNTASPTQIDLFPAPNADVTVRILGSDNRLLATKQIKGAEGPTSLILQPKSKPAALMAAQTVFPDFANQHILGSTVLAATAKTTLDVPTILPNKRDLVLGSAAPLLTSDYIATSAIISNGDFEQGVTGWVEQSSGGYAIITDLSVQGVQAHSGKWAAWLGGVHNEVSFIKQSFVVPATQPRLVYWQYIDSADDCGYDFAGIVVNGTVAAVQNLCVTTKTNGWVEVTHDLAQYAGQTIDLQLRVETDDSNLSHWLVDDVSIVYQETAPVNENLFIEAKANNKTISAGNEVGINVKQLQLAKVTLTSATIGGPTSGQTDTNYNFTATYLPTNAAMSVTYSWSPEPLSGQGTANATYVWTSAGTPEISVTIGNGVNTVTTKLILTITEPVPSTPTPSATPTSIPQPPATPNSLYLPVVRR